MSDTSHVDDLLIEIETRLQRVRNDIGKLDQAIPSNRVNFQNEIQTQLDAIQSKISELRAGSQSLPSSSREFYFSEAKTLSATHKQLQSDFKKQIIIPTDNPTIQPLSPVEKNSEKAEEVIQKLDDTIQDGVNIVSKKLDTELKKIESRLQRIKGELDILDQCLPSQRTNYQMEIQKQLDVIQSKINKVINTSRSLPPQESAEFNERAKTFLAIHQQFLIDLRNKETPLNDVSVKPFADDVPVERSINIESINDFIDPNDEPPKKKCFNPCLNNYVIWTIVVVLACALGFSLYWKLWK